LGYQKELCTDGSGRVDSLPTEMIRAGDSTPEVNIYNMFGRCSETPRRNKAKKLTLQKLFFHQEFLSRNFGKISKQTFKEDPKNKMV
jgi:hypothetical protein